MNKEYIKIVARPDFMNLPDWGLPIYARSVGHYRLPLQYEEEAHLNENFVQLFWGVAGCGEIAIDGIFYPLNPGDVIWKSSHQTHGYRSLSSNWELRWLTFDGELADAIITSYRYSQRLADAGRCPVEHFLDIEYGLQKMTPHEFRRLGAVFLSVLALAGCGGAEDKVSDQICERYIELVHKNFMNETVNVNTLASVMRMHRTTLTRHFRNRMSCTPGEYLKQFRLQRAVTLLKGGGLTVAEIAVQVGIPDPSQFSRVVKQSLGRSPKMIRGLFI